mgnify:CR=1 FL=1
MNMQAGYKTLVKIDGTLVAGQADSSLSTSTEMLNVHSGLTSAVEVRPVRTGATVSVTINYTDAVYSSLLAKQLSGTPITLYYGSTTAGEKYYQATAYIQNISRTDPLSGMSSLTLEMAISGDIVELTV